MNCRAKRVMFLGTPDHPSMLIEFADGRLAQMYQTPNSPFWLTLEEKGGKSDVVEINSDYFRLFLKALIAFFETGEIPVPHSQTVDVIAIREAGLKAMQTPYAWVNV